MLLGRERERQALGRLLDEARSGRSGVLVLVGEAGIGKSALLDHAAELAVAMRVLRARGVASEAQIPFAALFELLRPALGSLGAIPRPQAAALEGALALRPARAEDRFAVAAATLSLLAAYAEEQPLLVLVDDVHWLDGSSADALLFAVRRLLAEPIAVVLAAREGQPSPLDGVGLPSLRLEGLDPSSAARLLHEQAPGTGADAAARLHRETGGNPLALLELAHEPLPDLVPDAPVPVVTSVAHAYVQRAEGLPERTRLALVLAAATDRGDLALLARTAARLELTLADVKPAEDAGLVAVREGRLEFRHPLARSAIYGAARADQRRRVHRALADELPDADADRRAWHLALAAVGPDEAASDALAQAAQRARGRSAYDVASQAFERAARLAPTEDRRGPLLHAAADAAWLGGLADRAVLLVDEAAHVVGNGPLAAEVDHLRGHIALRRGPLGAAHAVLLGAAERADPASAVVMLAEAAEGAFYAADTAALLECGARASALAAEDGSDRTAFFAAIADGMALVIAGEGGRGAASIRDAMQVVQRSDGLRTDPRLLVWAAIGPLWLREGGAAHDLVDDVVARARARSAVGVLPHLLLHVAIAHATTDRWVEAQVGFDEAIRLARETGQEVVLAGALSRLAWLEARVGREASCRSHAEEALAIARERGVLLCEIWSLAALGELELVLGRLEQALARVEEQTAAIEQQGIADADLFPGAERVEILLRLGRVDEAAGAATAYASAAAAKGQPWALARAARAAALVADDDAFAPAFEDALSLHARTADVFEHTRTTLAYGARLRRDGQRVRARERLREALATFDALGAEPWAELARAELAATGETARRRAARGVDELTPQEQQISLLLAGGRTTRETAAALFLSPKTIEYHLRNVYRKLGIHSRDELRRALETTPGPTPDRAEA
ncbi:MAG: helix-turn-helix transcriptional regulator [Pseudomonadota bacterium]